MDQTPLRPHERAGLQASGIQPAVLSDVARCLGPMIQPTPCAQCNACERQAPSSSDMQPWIAPATEYIDGEWTVCVNRRFHDRNGAPDGNAGKPLTVGPLVDGAEYAGVQTRGVSL
jgi:hypothetical protein